MNTYKRYLTIFGLICALFFTPINASHASDGSNIGYMVGSGFSSLLYTPIKGAYAIVMGVTGGLSLMATLPASRSDISLDLVNLGFGGDWWVSPDHLRGKRPLHFNGYTSRQPTQVQRQY